MLLALCSLTVGVFAQGNSQGNSNSQGHDSDSQGQDSDDRGGGKHHESIMWINHLDFLAGDASVVTSFNAVSSGVGSGLSGLIIMSTTIGDTVEGGNKVVEKGLQVPPGFLVTGVRVCYELSNTRSFIDQIRLSQLQDPPSKALVLLDDATHLANSGPVCVDSAPTTVNPAQGEIRLDLRVNFGDTSDRIVVRAVGLHLGGKGKKEH
jgi:hypothetical protein